MSDTQTHELAARWKLATLRAEAHYDTDDTVFTIPAYELRALCDAVLTPQQQYMALVHYGADEATRVANTPPEPPPPNVDGERGA